MPSRSSLIVLAVIACGRKHSPPPEAEVMPGAVRAVIVTDLQQLAEQGAATARAARGTIGFRAWRYAGWSAPAGRQWVAVDVDFGAVAIDPDHAELTDADGDEVAAIGDVQRLDADGQRIPSWAGGASDRRYLFRFDLPATTRRVRLGAWGVSLTEAPVVIAGDGPIFSDPSREVLRHWVDGDRHVFLVEERNADDPPSLGGDWFKDVDHYACKPRGIVAVDHRLAPVAPPADPPALIERARYLVDFRCTQAPHVLDWGRDGAPIPAAEPLHLGDAALAALAGRVAGAVVLELAQAGRARVAVRRDGSLVAVAPGRALEVRLLDPITGAELARLPAPPNSALLALAFTPDGQRLVGVEADGDVILWDVARRAQLATRRLVPPPQTSTLAMSPDGRTIAVDHPLDDTVAWSGRITLLATADLSPRATVRVVRDTKHAVSGFGFSPDSNRLVVCASDGGTRVYASPSGGTLTTIRAPAAAARATACAITPDGRVVTGFADQLAIYAADGRRVATIAADGAGVTAIAVRTDGTFVTGGGDGRVLGWSADGKRATPLAHLRHPIGQVLVDGELVVAANVDDVAVVAADGRALARLPGGVDGGEARTAIGGSVVVVVDPLVASEIARVRIWRAEPAAR